MTRAVLVLAIVSACRITAPFECDLDEQCREGDLVGTCHFATYCAFPDDECPSGKRYADNAGGDLAGTCIGGAPVADDAGIDAAPFDVTTCPETYNRDLGNASSRYRLITTEANVWTQAAACAQDLPGATHLVVIDDVAERDALRGSLSSLPFFPSLAFVGIVQDPAATDPAAGWIHFDGRPVASTLWAANQPDNNSQPETAVHANAAQIAKGNPALADAVGTHQAQAFCECDGVPVHAMAQAFLDGDPSKP